MPTNAVIYGCQGPELGAEERAFFARAHPFGFILFARNCVNPEQIKALCRDLRSCIQNPTAPILIDQEGGRVARLKPPHWRWRSPARRFGDMFESDPAGACDAAYLCARLIAHDLNALGVNVDCAPVLDVPAEGAHDIIGDRAFSRDPAVVIELGRASIEGFLDGGVLPVIKHIPGHGRAMVDSHHALPRVTAPRAELERDDFLPFKGLNSAPMAMTAHVVYEAIDPSRPATMSKRVIHDVIRGEIGFDGLLMSDDLSMSALEGAFGDRTRAALDAGCDVVLHCNGCMDEMTAIAHTVTPLSGAALCRAEDAMAQCTAPLKFDPAAAEARLDTLMGTPA